LIREKAVDDRLQAESAKSRYTFGRLLRLYVESLAARDAASTKGTRSALELHIHKRRPELAAKAAQDVTTDDIIDIIAALNQEGKHRTAGLVRSHVSAAFNLGRKSNVTAPQSMREFNLKGNPVQDTPSAPVATRERVLAISELRAFLKRVEASEGAIADLVQACILLGGQRPQQIARARLADYDADAQTLTVWDRKGRRAQPRKHVLPLCSDALALIEQRTIVATALDSELLFSSRGPLPVQLPRVSKWIADTVAGMLKDRELKEPFQLRDVRRTAETQLASLGVVRDLRAQLLSHGLSGLQSQRYDRYDYMKEKRRVLQRWEKHLRAIRAGDALKAKVVPLPSGVDATF